MTEHSYCSFVPALRYVTLQYLLRNFFTKMSTLTHTFEGMMVPRSYRQLKENINLYNFRLLTGLMVIMTSFSMQWRGWKALNYVLQQRYTALSSMHLAVVAIR